jgi:hypothetical protein
MYRSSACVACAPEPDVAILAAFPEDGEGSHLQINVLLDAKAGQLRKTKAGVQERHHDGVVSTLLEPVPFARGQQCLHLLGGQDRDLNLGEHGRLHPLHR